MHGGIGMQWTKLNTHIRTWLFPKPVFLASWCSIKVLARALIRDVERGDSKVSPGIAPPIVTCACFEIKCLNMFGVLSFSS